MEERVLFVVKTTILFFITAVAEIVGCYLPYLWLKKNGSILLLIPGAISLGIFVYLLSLHPVESGRIYAAYGGVYIITAMVWLVVIDRGVLNIFDVVGAIIVLIGSLVMIVGWELSRRG